MRVNRTKFIQHLNRLECAGQCTEVVFRDGFAAQALTADHLLLIKVPSLEGTEPLPREIGVTNIDILRKALRLTPGEGNTGVEVDVHVKDNRLVIDDRARGGAEQFLVIATPKTIQTVIEPENADQLFANALGIASVTLTRSILEGVCSAFSLYKAEEIAIEIGPKGGKICVGSKKTNRAEFPLDDARSREEFVLLFGKHLVDVFSIVTDYSSATMQCGGPEQPVVIIDGEYRYLLSPRRRSADEGKPPIKTAPAEGEEEREPIRAGRAAKAADAAARGETPKARARKKVAAR